MIDEIHRRGPRTTAGAETADLSKDLTERIGATFVYAGATPLFTGVRGAQLAGRASLVECGAFPARLGGAEPFLDLVTTMENILDLRAHRAGTPPRSVSYLRARTAERIGSLARLVRQAAIGAILDGTERITKASLDTVRLDHLAKEHHRPRNPARARATPARATPRRVP